MDKSYDATSKGLGTTDKPKGRTHLHEMRIRKAKGGFVAEHRRQHANGEEAHGHADHGTEHVMRNKEEVKAHIDKHFGGAAEQEGGDSDESHEMEAAEQGGGGAEQIQ